MNMRKIKERLNGRKFNSNASGDMTIEEFDNHLLDLEGVLINSSFKNLSSNYSGDDILFSEKNSKMNPYDLKKKMEGQGFFNPSDNYEINHQVFESDFLEKHYFDFIHQDKLEFDTGIVYHDIPKEAHLFYSVKKSL